MDLQSERRCASGNASWNSLIPTTAKIQGVSVSERTSSEIFCHPSRPFQRNAVANLRLEKGTDFSLVLTQSASVGIAKDQ
jgi:hypothetical protein